MKTLKMILLTKSSKYKGYCVAGIDCASGKWVRLMSTNPEASGALDNQMMYDSHQMRYAEVLDQVLVDIAESRPTVVQPENIMIAQNPNMRILGRVSLQDVLTLHAHDQHSCIFGSNNHIVQVDVESLGHSLELIDAKDLELHDVVNSSGRTKSKLDFSYRGKLYSTFSVTDPDYYGRGPLKIPHATLVLSIADGEWSRLNGYYIFVAKIFDGRDYFVGSRVAQRSMAAPQPIVTPPLGSFASKPSAVARPSKLESPIVPAIKHTSVAPITVASPVATAVKPISASRAPTLAVSPTAAAAVRPVSSPPLNSTVPKPVAGVSTTAAAAKPVATPPLSTTVPKPIAVVPTIAATVKPTENPPVSTAAPMPIAVAPTTAAAVKPTVAPRANAPLPKATVNSAAQTGSRQASASVPEVSSLTRLSTQPISQSPKHHRKRRVLFLLLAAVLTLIFLMTVANGTSYIAPYSGKSYHSTKTCQGLRNAHSVVQRPTLWLKLYMKPCGYCHK